MIVLGKLILVSFKQKHAASCAPLDAWEAEAEEAAWANPKQVKERYRGVDLSPNRIVFSLTQGLYKLAVKTKFEKGILLIERVWTEPKAARAPATKK